MISNSQYRIIITTLAYKFSLDIFVLYNFHIHVRIIIRRTKPVVEKREKKKTNEEKKEKKTTDLKDSIRNYAFLFSVFHLFLLSN